MLFEGWADFLIVRSLTLLDSRLAGAEGLAMATVDRPKAIVEVLSQERLPLLSWPVVQIRG